MDYSQLPVSCHLFNPSLRFGVVEVGVYTPSFQLLVSPINIPQNGPYILPYMTCKDFRMKFVGAHNPYGCIVHIGIKCTF